MNEPVLERLLGGHVHAAGFVGVVAAIVLPEGTGVRLAARASGAQHPKELGAQQ